MSLPTPSPVTYYWISFFGAKLHWAGKERRGEPPSDLVESLKTQGKSPYLIPYAGSNPTGALSYTDAIKERVEQPGPEFGHIIFASCSGGPHAGMLGASSNMGSAVLILGIRIDKQDPASGSYGTIVAELTQATADKLAVILTDKPIQLNTDYMQAGYAVLGQQEIDAIHLLARTEGILLDPVYSGRAFAGLVDLVRQGHFDSQSPVLFWHTGGSPALFAYSQSLTE